MTGDRAEMELAVADTAQARRRSLKMVPVQGLQRYFTDGRLQVIHTYQDRQGIFIECMIGNYLISSALLRGNKCSCNKRQFFYNNHIVNSTFYENT